jgi:hypothetical protein
VFAKNKNVSYRDVLMKLFIQSLEEDARIQYNGLVGYIIKGWHDLEKSFLDQWGDKKDVLFLLVEFIDIKKREK